MRLVVLKIGEHKKKELDKPFINAIDPICSSVTLLKAENKDEYNILVDTGYFGFEDEILRALGKEGLKAEDIDYVINTHEHYDHTANNYLFKNARKIIGTLEWQPDKSIKVYNCIKDINLGDNIQIIETPGHKDPHYSVVVKLDKVYVIAGDTITKEFFVAPFEKAHDKIKSAEKLMGLGDVIIPGHGPIINKEDIDYVRKKIQEIKNNIGGI